MPPCGFVAWSQLTFGKPYPCPSCGFTTTFALSAHGHLWGAIKNQPFGFVVFCGFLLLIPVSLLCTLGHVSPLRSSDHWPWRWICGVFFLMWIGGWVYKIGMMS
jgi:hypothetical protein